MVYFILPAYLLRMWNRMVAGSNLVVDNDLCHDRVVDDRFQYALFLSALQDISLNIY